MSLTSLEWQVAEGSSTLHLVDPGRAAPRRSGRRAMCGRYPQTGGRETWFSLRAEEFDLSASTVVGSYNLKVCRDCADIESSNS